MMVPPGLPPLPYPLRESTQAINPDEQCAVPLIAGNVIKRGVKNPRCQNRLSCRVHSTEQKERVGDRSPSFAQALQQQPLLLRSGGDGGSTGPATSRATVIDPDVHCAVLDDAGVPCARQISCHAHTVSEKGRISGRILHVTDLSRIYTLNRSAETTLRGKIFPNIHCHVELPQGGYCPRKLSCPLHSLAQKREVERIADFTNLLELQMKHTLDTDMPRMEGFGLASAAAAGDATFGTIHKTYRRDGMQTAATELNIRGEVADIDFLFCHPAGRNLENLRSALYHTPDTRPSRNLTDFLPQKQRLTLHSRILDDGATYHFCFTDQSRYLRTTMELMRDVLNNAKLTECCMISAPKEEYAIDDTKATMLERRLLDMVERVDCPLSRLTDSVKHRLLVTALSMDVSHPCDVPAKIPYNLEQAIVDDKPVVLLRTTQFYETRLDRHSTHTAIAIPLHADFKEAPVAAPSTIFEFRGLETKKTWSGVKMTPEIQSHIRKVAQNIVSEVHLIHAEPGNTRWALLQLSEMHGIPLLFRKDDNGEFNTVGSSDETIAHLNEASGLITPSSKASLTAPFLVNIQTIPGTNSGHLVMQCINARFLHTKDLLLAWADGANGSDMHYRSGDEVMQAHCLCSEEQSTREYHSCVACRALSVCKGLTMTQVGDIEVSLCARCVYTRSSDLSQTGRQHSTESGDQSLRAGQSARSSSVKPERDRVRNNISIQILREYDQVFTDRDGLEAERQAAVNALLGNYRPAVGDQPAHWIDTHFDNPIVATEGRLACSVEADQPLVWRNNKVREHVVGNMLLTKAYANSLAASNGGIALQLLHKLDAATTTQEKADYVLRIDHLHLIRSQVPWSEKKRFAVEHDVAFQTMFNEQWQTGVANATACEKIAEQDTETPYLWRLKLSKTWTYISTEQLPEIRAVQNFIRDLEQETSYRFRRLGDNVPYPFVGGPDPRNWSWCVLFGVIQYSYAILMRSCNSRGTTKFDLPRLVCAVFYLIANNGCPVASALLRLPISCYTRHQLSFSVGKGKHALDMDSGLSSDLPISLVNFNPEACNLCIEPWCCNTAKGNRDDETEAIREDFRKHLKQHNPPYWSQDLQPLDDEVTQRYITSAPQATGDLDDDYFQPPRGNSSRDDDRDLWEPVLSRRNMKNLGGTCYLSTLLQTLHNNESFRNLVSDENKFQFKDTTGMPDFPFLPPGEVASELSGNEIRAYRQQKLLNIRLLIYKLQKLFNSLDTGGVQLSARDTRAVLDRVADLDPRWGNRSEESAQLLDLFIDYLGMACDSSSATRRGELRRLNDQQESSNNQGVRIWDASLDIRLYWAAFCHEGHESVVTDMFISQVIKEVPCAQEGCFIISRGFEHLFIEHLDFPRGCAADDEFNLEELLDIWKHERLDEQAGGHKCEHVPDHPMSFEAHRRFSKPGQNICFAFRRGPLSEGEIHYANPVSLPQILDLAPYSELDGLPSRWGEATPTEIPRLEYDLVSVNNWKSGHYMGYALANIQNEEKWVMFNDLRGVPTNKTPFEGHAEGETLHYAVYKKRTNIDPDPQPAAGHIAGSQQPPAGGNVIRTPGRIPGGQQNLGDKVSSAPGRIASDQQPSTGDDVFGTPGGHPSPTGPYTLPARGGSASLRPRARPSDESLLFRRPSTGPSPQLGSPLHHRRRLSGGASNDSSPKSPRLGHHSDVSVARRELAAKDAEIHRQAGELDRLRQQQRSQQQLRPGDVVIRQERLHGIEERGLLGDMARHRLQDIASRQFDISRHFEDLTRERVHIEATYWTQRAELGGQYHRVRTSLLDTRQQLQNTFRPAVRSQLSTEVGNLELQLHQITLDLNLSYTTFQTAMRSINFRIQTAGVDLINLMSSSLDLNS